MAETATTRPSSAMNETELEPYKPLFGPAICTFVVGLISVFALVPWHALLVLPLATVFTGVWSLLKLRRVTDTRAGRRGVLLVVVCALVTVAFCLMAVLDAVSTAIVPTLRNLRAPTSMLTATYTAGPFVLLGMMGAATVLAVLGLAKLPKIAADAVSGERLIRTGLTLGLVFTAAGTVNAQIPQQMLLLSAIRTGHEWLSAISHNQFEKVIILALHPVERPPESITMEQLKMDRDMSRALNELKQVPLVQTLTALGPEVDIRFDGIEDVIYRGNGSEVQVAYRVTVPPQEGQSKSNYFLVALQMVVDRNRRTGVQEWRIYDHRAPYIRGNYQLPKHAEQVHEH